MKYIQNRKQYRSLLLLLFLISFSCSKKVQIKDIPKIEVLRNELHQQFESEEADNREIFRFFISSEDYIHKQLRLNETINLAEDTAGDQSFSKELKPYNKINLKAKAIVKIVIYEDTGTLSRIRFLRSSGVAEIDKLISEDITRWRFEFPKKKIEPLLFEVSFYIFLKSEINKEEAKIELKKYLE